MFLDFRSDTFTQPTDEMKKAMTSAPLGDDVYGEDPTVNALEAQMADILGKESALFTPTCTMANLAAVHSHCGSRFSEYIVGRNQHLYIYEVGGASTIAGVHSQVLDNQRDGTLSLDQVARGIRIDDIHFPRTDLIAVENTVNNCGGRVLKPEYLDELGKLAKERNVKVHMDGARLFNAAAAYGGKVSDLVRSVDSVSVCFSKGLCCPTGAVLAGEKEFIRKARQARKAFGGGLRQAGVIAACGIVAMNSMRERLVVDNKYASDLAKGLSQVTLKGSDRPLFEVQGGLDSVESNLFRIEIPGLKAQAMKEELKANYGILVDSYLTDNIRIVTHRDVDPQKLDYVVDSFRKAARTVYSSNAETANVAASL